MSTSLGDTGEMAAVFVDETAADTQREAAYRTGYDDAAAGHADHYESFAASVVEGAYRDGYSAGVLDRQEATPPLVLVASPVGRRYQPKHRRSA